MKNRVLGLSLLTFFLSASVHAQYATGDRLAGKDGWFFVVDEFRFFKQERPEIVYDTTDTLSLIDKIMKDRGIEFYPTIVPIRARIYASELPNGLVLPNAVLDRYNIILAEFRRNNIHEINLNDLFISMAHQSVNIYPLYIKGDHHWSSVGSIATARLIADQINKDIDLSSFPTFESTIITGNPTILPKEPLVSDNKPVAKTQTELYSPVIVDRAASLDLLADQSQPIVLVGDSFSRGEIDSVGLFPFSSVIENFTNHEVFNYSKGGIGSWSPLLDYFRSSNYEENPPKALIWEMWELYATGSRWPVPDSFLSDIGPVAMGICKNPISVDFGGQTNKAGQMQLSMASYINFNLPKASNAASIVFKYRNSSITKTLYNNTDKISQFNILIPFKNDKLEDIIIADSNGKSLPTPKFELCEMPKYFTDAISLNGKSINYNSRDFHGIIRTTGFYESSDQQNYRWGLGKKSDIYFNSSRNAPGVLDLEIYSPFPNQSITVSINGKKTTTLKIGRDRKVKYKGDFYAKIGENLISFSYSDWKNKNSDNENLVDINDQRNLASAFNILNISLR